MGYTTDFTGVFKLNKKLDFETHHYLNRFNESRRMKRKFDHDQFGVDGEFYVEGSGSCGQDNEENVVDHNRPPSTQPGLWCQWRPTENGHGIEWDGGEKFYSYVEWIKYIIVNFLAPKGYILNGEVEWQGEDSEDFGIIAIQNNKVFTMQGRRGFDEPQEA